MKLASFLSTHLKKFRTRECAELIGTPGRSSPTLWRLEFVHGFGSVGKRKMKSWRCHDEIRASSDEIFSLRLQMKLNPPPISPRQRDFIA